MSSILEFKEATKIFFDGDGIKEISFSIEEGEFVFLTGPSGSGKTTLMRLLMAEYKLDSGEILFEQTEVHKLRRGQLPYHRRSIGVVYQDYRLVATSNVWENIALPLKIVGQSSSEIENRVTDLLKLVNLTTKAHLFPQQLSGGEAQRVSIARSLALSPSLVFADEPTGNLDPETSKHILALFKKINKLGTTIIMATHDHDLLAESKSARHLEVNKGELVKDSGAKEKSKPKSEPKSETKKEEKKDSKKEKDSSSEEKNSKKEEKK